MAGNNENKNVNTDKDQKINKPDSPNVNIGEVPPNNAVDDEFVGLRELFGDISLDGHNLTQEQQEYIMEQIRKKALFRRNRP